MMDPNATAEIMRDDGHTVADRTEAAKALKGWLIAGGFPQRLYSDGATLRRFDDESAHRRAAIEECEMYLNSFSVRGAV